MEEKLKAYNPTLSFYSVRTYLSLFNTICRKIGQPFTNNKDWFNENKDKVLEYVGTLESPHSKKTKLAVVTVMAKAYGLTDSDLVEYTALIEQLANSINVFNKSHQLTEEQRENYMTLEELNEVLRKMQKKLIKTTDITEWTEYNLWVKYFVLYMIVVGKYALRNNWVNMKIVKTSTPPADKTHNYIIWSKKNNKVSASLCLNQYKTAKTYGAKCFTITDENILKLIPKIHFLLEKFSKDGYLVVKQDGDVIAQDQFSKWFAGIFREYSDKHLTSTALRHIIASSQWTPDEIDKQEDREQEADVMGHSSEQAFNTYVKKMD
jgi:hypothetical protein